MGYRQFRSVPSVQDTRYGAARPGFNGVGLDFVEDADSDAIITRLKDLVGISTGDVAEDFKDTYAPPKTPAAPATSAPPAAAPPRPAVSAAPPVAAPPAPVRASGAGLSTGTIVGVGVVATGLVAGLVWAKKKGKFR